MTTREKRRRIGKKVTWRHRVFALLSSMIMGATMVGGIFESGSLDLVASADETIDYVAEKEEATRWLSFLISQSDLQRTTSCTGCSSLAILQNCGVLDPEWQFGEPGNPVIMKNQNTTNSSGKTFMEFAQACNHSLINGGAGGTLATTSAEATSTGRTYGWWWYGDRSGLSQTTLDNLTAGKLHQIAMSDADSNMSAVAYGNATAIVGIGGKEFKSMTKEELIEAFQLIWENGFLAITCGGQSAANNGPDGYKADHASFLAGVSEHEVWIADVWDGVIDPVLDWRSVGADMIFVILFKADGISPVEMNGGTVRNNADLTANSDGTLTLNGFWDESEFVPVAYTEQPVYVMPMFEDLDIQDQMAVRDWRDTIEMERENKGVTFWLRSIVAFMGIIVILYSVFLYIAYQFDMNQTFLDIQFLEVVTFGQLKIAPDVNKSTYGLDAGGKKKGVKFVVHRDMIAICLIGITIGVLLISGKIYALIHAIIKAVKDLID